MVLYGVFKILIKMLFYLDLSGKNLRAKNLKQKLRHQVVEAEALKVEAEAIQKNCRFHVPVLDPAYPENDILFQIQRWSLSNHNFCWQPRR